MKALASDNDDDETTVAAKAMEATAAESIFMLPEKKRMTERIDAAKKPAESVSEWHNSKFRVVEIRVRTPVAKKIFRGD